MPLAKEFAEEVGKPLSEEIVKQARRMKWDWASGMLRWFAPEKLSVEGKKVDAMLAKTIMEHTQLGDAFVAIRRPFAEYFDRLPKDKQFELLVRYQRGEKDFTKYGFEKEINDYFRNHAKEMNKTYQEEQLLGFKTEYIEDYIQQQYKDTPRLRELISEGKIGRLPGGAPGKPMFTKHRFFEDYLEAALAGLEPRTTNPEELLWGRKLSHYNAKMRLQALEELEKTGLAEKIGKTSGPGHSTVWAPNGTGYNLRPDIKPLWDNAMSSMGSLWQYKPYRGFMYAKNIIVPVKLALSLFHPLHVSGIDIASRQAIALEHAIKGGVKSWPRAAYEFAKAVIPVAREWKSTWGVMKAWEKMPKDMTDYEKYAVQTIVEGGGSPLLSKEFRTQALNNFSKAVRQGNYLGAAGRTVPALVEGMQYPIFNFLVPELKTASYLKEAELLFKRRPELLHDTEARMQVLRDIWKSHDNRYGELVYKTLFWDRRIKDASIASFLSLGWQLGFWREFPQGAVSDPAKAIFKAMTGKSSREDITRKTLFTLLYTMQAAIVGGTLTYLMTGKEPTKIVDLFYPQNGEKDKYGNPGRWTTPYYTREPFAMAQAFRTKGVIGGTADYAGTKLAPVTRDLYELAHNKDFYGIELTNPHDPMIKQAGQLAKYFVETLEPISMVSTDRIKKLYPLAGPNLTYASYLGLTPAPQYITREGITREIFEVAGRYGQQTFPYAERETRELKGKIKDLYSQGKSEEAIKMMEQAVTDRKLSTGQAKYLLKTKDIPVEFLVFKRLPVLEQLFLLEKMSPEEVERYRPYASKEAMRQFEMKEK